MALATLTLVESLRLPTLSERSIPIYSAPGLVPGLLGCAIFALALVLFVRSVWTLREGAAKPGAAAEGPGNPGMAGRLAVALGLALIYGVLMVGHLPYWLATGLFVFVFIVVFEWRLRGPGWARLRMVGVALVLAVAVSGVVSLVFEKLFLVRLP